MLGFQRKTLLKYWMKRNKGDVHQRLLMTSVMAQTRPCVSVCALFAHAVVHACAKCISCPGVVKLLLLYPLSSGCGAGC